MKRTYTVFVLIASTSLLLSWSANPPDGRCGAPGDGLCSDCHGLAGGTQDGSITITGFPLTIQPDATYMLTITNSNPNGDAVRAGFQVTILNSSNQKAGTFLPGTTDPSSTISSLAGREYWEHNPFQLYPGSNFVTWTVNWKAPPGPPNTTITYYAAGNVANGNGNNQGDLIVTSTGSGTLNTAGDPLEVEIVSSTNVSCDGGNNGSASAAAMHGTMPYTFAWSNGGSGTTINNLSAGTYTVTVTDAVSTTATATVVITEPPAIVLQAAGITNVSCNGGNNGSIQANPTGGVPPYTYNWSTGATTSAITGLAAGSYTVTVTDSNDCTKSASYNVTQPAALEIDLENLNHESCAGENDGSITISVSGGVNPIFAEWSNGFIGTTISDLSPDSYSVTVTDNNNCTSDAIYVINAGGVVNVTLEQLTHVTCNGGNNGAVSVIANGGQAPYAYVWSNGGVGPSIINLVAGNYLVTVTDNNACQVIKLYTVNQPAPISIQISSTGQNLCSADTLVDLTAVVNGSQPPFTASWSNGVVGLVNENLPAGTYIITVIDNAGCTATSSFTVTSSPALLVSVSATDESGNNLDDGTAIANVSGGTPAYSYLWNNGATTDSIGGLTPGIYTVTVTDNNGCTASASGQVDPFGCALDAELGADLTICENDSTTFGPIVTGAIGSVSYLWSDGSTDSNLVVYTGGEYCVTVNDESSCQEVDCIIVTQVSFPMVTCPITHESAPGMNDGAIECDSFPEIVSYLWTNGETTASIFDLAPGEYCVFMTNLEGCTSTQCFIIQSGGCQLVITSISDNVLCAGDSTGSVSVTVENATDPVTYLWSTGDTSSSVFNLPAGNYNVTVGDGDGCGEILTYTITQPSPLVITVDSVQNITGSPGAVSITVTGGVEPFSYAWTGPDAYESEDEDISDIGLIGYYFLLVTDANGCAIAVDSILVDEELAVGAGPKYNAIRVYPVPTDDVLFVDMDNQIIEALITGVDGRLYKRYIQPASNRLEVSDLQPGWYIVRISDGESWYIARMVK